MLTIAEIKGTKSRVALFAREENKKERNKRVTRFQFAIYDFNDLIRAIKRDAISFFFFRLNAIFFSAVRGVARS